VTIGLVGRISPWKGQELFLRAFARAFPDGTEQARLVGGALFGEEDLVASLEDLSAALGITDRVTFVGHVRDVPAELAKLDILVHASTIPEPFGQVVVEAMAAGVPVVAADAGGPSEVVTDGVDGLLYPMGDVDALAERLGQLASDPTLRAELVAQGHRTVSLYGPERMAAEVQAVYAELLGG
jgi:glycosyltransferase involved in cell wall biosynthesis